jgi:hypothetical protein
MHRKSPLRKARSQGCGSAIQVIGKMLVVTAGPLLQVAMTRIAADGPIAPPDKEPGMDFFFVVDTSRSTTADLADNGPRKQMDFYPDRSRIEHHIDSLKGCVAQISQIEDLRTGSLLFLRQPINEYPHLAGEPIHGRLILTGAASLSRNSSKG